MKWEAFPESRLQDLYKSFFQDRLGPGHHRLDILDLKEDKVRIDEMAHNIVVNEDLENAYAPLTKQDIIEIHIASL